MSATFATLVVWVWEEGGGRGEGVRWDEVRGWPLDSSGRVAVDGVDAVVRARVGVAVWGCAVAAAVERCDWTSACQQGSSDIMNST